MHDWHLSPKYINANWSEELLILMFQCRTKRHERLAAIREKRSLNEELGFSNKKLDSEEFFGKHNFAVRKVN